MHRQQYFEAFDTVKGEIINRFLQKRGIPVAATLERILLNTFTSSTIDIPEDITQLYSKDIDIDRLEIQLQMLPDLLKTFNSANP